MSRSEEVHLIDPVAVYTAESNAQAKLLASILVESGVPAVAIEDLSPGGLFSLGTLSELHRPQVFVDTSNIPAAADLIRDFEGHSATTSETFCYHCGSPVATMSSECDHCGSTLQWDGVVYRPLDETGLSNHDLIIRPSKENGVSGGVLEVLKQLRRPAALLLLVIFGAQICVVIAGVAYFMFRR